jgi:hypothetical protein
LKDETIIKQYYNTLWTLDRSNQPALSLDYEKELCKKRDKLEKEIDKRKLWNHQLLIEMNEVSYK